MLKTASRRPEYNPNNNYFKIWSFAEWSAESVVVRTAVSLVGLNLLHVCLPGCVLDLLLLLLRSWTVSWVKGP